MNNGNMMDTLLILYLLEAKAERKTLKVDLNDECSSTDSTGTYVDDVLQRLIIHPEFFDVPVYIDGSTRTLRQYCSTEIKEQLKGALFKDPLFNINNKRLKDGMYNAEDVYTDANYNNVSLKIVQMINDIESSILGTMRRVFKRSSDDMIFNFYNIDTIKIEIRNSYVYIREFSIFEY